MPDEDTWSGIFCLEGDWDGDDLNDQSTVEPLLELLQKLGHVTYRHRDVGTRAELEHYVDRWLTQDEEHYVLYLAFHGIPGGLWLSDADDGTVSLEELADWMEGALGDCVVHFGSCAVLSANRAELRAFVRRTGVRAVTGYREDVDWVDSSMLDLALFKALADHDDVDAALDHVEHAPQYAGLREQLGFVALRR